MDKRCTLGKLKQGVATMWGLMERLRDGIYLVRGEKDILLTMDDSEVLRKLNNGTFSLEGYYSVRKRNLDPDSLTFRGKPRCFDTSVNLRLTVGELHTCRNEDPSVVAYMLIREKAEVIEYNNGTMIVTYHP